MIMLKYYLRTTLLLIMATMSVNCWASSLLCSQGPTAPIQGEGNQWPIYKCTIPANAIVTLKAIRVTVGIRHVIGTQAVDYVIYLNGVSAVGSNVVPLDQYFDVTILNTGSTTGAAAGIVPGTLSEDSLMSGLSWASNQTLQVTFAVPNSDFVEGILFTVEAID